MHSSEFVSVLCYIWWEIVDKTKELLLPYEKRTFEIGLGYFLNP